MPLKQIKYHWLLYLCLCPVWAYSGNCERDTAYLNRLDSLALDVSYRNADSAINMAWNGLLLIKRMDCPDSVKDYHMANLYFRMASAHMNKDDYALSVEYLYLSLHKFLAYRYYEDAADCYHQIGYAYMMLDNYPAALEQFKYALIINRIKKRDDEARNLINMGNCYIQLGRYNEALNAFIESLKLKEQQGDQKGITNCMVNIGAVHYILKNNRESLDYYFRALERYQNDKNEMGQAQVYNNIGLIYMAEKKYDLADEAYHNSIKIYKVLDKQRKIGATLSNLGKNAMLQKDFAKAREYYNEYHTIAEKLNDKSSQSSNFTNLAGIEKETGNFDKALQYYFKAIELTDELGIIHDKDRMYLGIAETYLDKQNYKSAAEWFSKYITLRDSVFNIEKASQMNELERKFQSERKQKEIEIQQEQLKRQQAEIDIQAQISEKQRFQRNAFIVGFVLSIFIVILVFRSYLQKKRTNKILAQQKDEIEAQRDQLTVMNNELSQKNDEISAQRDEIESQRDLLMIRKNQIEKIHRELTDSIQYAKRIQGAIMPTSEQLDGIFKEYFLMFRPRDIVSGDFYWAARRGDWIIFCVADCTGHGVPGAFMSMLGISFLNEIVKNEKITRTSDALNELRGLIIASLKQKDSYTQENLLSSVKDGMDIALCALNTVTLEMQFSGANNPCWIVKSNKELTELPSDSMPVAIHTVMTGFTETSVQLEKGDMIYLMSDGFQDQFGGKSGKKFMRKKLRELLTENSALSCSDQLQLLNRQFDEWHKGYPQVDDVTVFGIRL